METEMTFRDEIIQEFRDLIDMEDSRPYDPRSEQELIHLATECADLFLQLNDRRERTLFEAFLNGYDAGYDAKASNMINDNVVNGVRYIRRNFNEDFEL